MKKHKQRGAILYEAGLSIMLNLALLLGGLEVGWYLHARQALVDAVREASRTDFQSVAEKTVQNYLIGLNFPDDFIDSVVVSFEVMNVNNPGPTKIHKVTATIPLIKVLLFGGDPSGIASASGSTSLSVSAYDRENKFNNAGGNGNGN